MRTQCLLEASPGVGLDVRVRFLQVVDRDVARLTGGVLEPVEELDVGGRRHLTWEEAVEREVHAGVLDADALLAGRRVPVAIDAGEAEEELRDDAGLRAGALIRRWRQLEGAIDVRAERVGDALLRVSVTVTNTSPWAGGSREDALKQTFCSTHTVLRATGGAFVSQTDPPDALRAAAAACDNDGTWPVLVGEPGERHTVLSSPIILEDYPRIAPESPGDLFDGGEIDQLLILNILSMTDAEKAEMRASDPKAREILERTEKLTPEQLMRLHGAIRDLRVVHR
jgi:hypothetical protein